MTNRYKILQIALDNGFKARVYSNRVCVSKNGFGVTKHVGIGVNSSDVLCKAILEFEQYHKGE